MLEIKRGMRKRIQKYVISLGEQIGKGCSGRVYKGSDTTNNHTVAVKVINLHELKTEIHKQLLKSEVESLLQLEHPNILRCYNVYTTVNNTYIITEYCQEGDLDSLLKRSGRMTQAKAAKIIVSIVRAFQELVRCGIVHRDIKPANIFVKGQEYKLADFGFSIKTNERDVLRCSVGTPLYMPPQALKENVYSHKSDIWAIGIISYQLLNGRHPYLARTETELIAKIQKTVIDFPPEFGISQSFKQLVTSCLTIPVEKRASAEQLSRMAGKLEQQFCADSVSRNQPKRVTRLDQFKRLSENVSDQGKIPLPRQSSYLSPRKGKEVSVERSESIKKMRKNRLDQYLEAAVEEKPEAETGRRESVPSWAEPRYESVNVREKERRRSLSKGKSIEKRERFGQPAAPAKLQTVQQKDELQKVSEKVLYSKMSYCRFMFKTLQIIEEVHSAVDSDVCERILFVLFKCISILLHSLTQALENRQNLYRLDDWEQFLASQSFEKYKLVHQQYRARYSQHFRANHYRTSNSSTLVENDALLENVARTTKAYVEQIRLLLQKTMQENPVAPLRPETQKLVVSLDLVVLFYQLNALVQSRPGDHVYFAKTSQVEKIAGGSPIEIERKHLEMIEEKIQSLRLAA